MLRLRHLSLPALAVAGGLSTASPAVAAEALTEDQRQTVQELIRETLIKYPEILVEAMQALEEKQVAAKAEAVKQAVAAHEDALFRNDDDVVMGNPDGDVTLVEFFDYRCGYCKAVFAPLMEVVQEDGNIRVIVKEFPILGPESQLATKWALAAREQDKYAEYHAALMKHRGVYSEAALAQIAGDVGLDVAKLKKDAASEAITRTVRETMALASALGIGGTPAFVIGEQLIPGAVDKEELKRVVAEARAAADKG